jgi:eukaryotic-like serine/threonine-protein kinase
VTDRPSESLIELLARLRLATPGQVESQAADVRRLAGDLPLLDVVWLDSLVQARLITPYQASEINAGRGEGLAVGPYVLVRPLAALGYADSFEGRHLESQARCRVTLLARGHRELKVMRSELDQLIVRSGRITAAGLLTLQAAGEDRGKLWAVSALEPAAVRRSAAPRWGSSPRPIRSATEWMVDSGRFPPAVVLHLAQRMVAALAEAESVGVVHGDVRAASLMCAEQGEVFLVHPGLRSIVRPAEGYALADLTPEAYETLAPERIANGTSPTVASDIYSCGCLWWHLLAGRSPLSGGNSLARLQAAHAAKVPDIRRVAPDTPEPLWRAIESCLARDPAARPASFAMLAELIGQPNRRGAANLAGYLRERKNVRSVLGSSLPRLRRRELVSTPQLMVAVVVLAMVSLLAWRRADWLRRPTPSQVAAVERTTAPPPKIDATGQVRGAQHQPTAAAPVRPAAIARTSDQRGNGPAKPPASPVAYWSADAVPPLVLPTDRTIELERIVPRAGQTVRAADGRRTRVIVSGRPAVLAVEGVTFENIDFVLGGSRSSDASGGVAILVVAAARAGFRQCTFEVRSEEAGPSTAIAWRGPPRSTRAAADWQGRLTLDRSSVRGFTTAIQCPMAQRATVELTDSLLVDCDSVVRLGRAPRGDEACEVWLSHVTARETGPLVRIDYEELPAAVGQLTIIAQESTLAPRRDEPLVLFAGPAAPDPLIAALEWQGQGSLVTPETTIAGSRFGDAQLERIADDELTVDGLVRSQVGFAGQSLKISADSQTIRWQAALQSSEPPGIDGQVP